MDGGSLILQLPRPGEPELATLPGMAVPAPREAVQTVQTPGALGLPDTSMARPTALQQPAAWSYSMNAAGVSEADYPGVSVKASNGGFPGAAGDGVTNDTAAIQRALNMGGKVYIPAGTYLVSSELLVPSDTLVQGDGPASRLLAAPIWTGTNGAFLINAHGLTALPPGTPIGFPFVEHDIIIRDLQFDYGNSNIVQNAAPKAVAMVAVQRATVTGCLFQLRGANNAVAFIGCDTTIVAQCAAYDFINCAWDFWTNPKRGSVINCYAQTATTCQMINFNPDATGMNNAIADTLLVQNCVNVCTGPIVNGSQIEPLGLITGGRVRNVIVTDSVFQNCSLLLRGDTANVVISNNLFLNPLGPLEVITAYPYNSGTGANIAIVGNMVIGAATTSGNQGVIRIEAPGFNISGNIVTGTFTAWAIETGSFTGGLLYANLASPQYTALSAPIMPLVSAASDAAAGTAGVPVQGLYQNAGVVHMRVS